jgi:SAM-dependent methyltransferase
MNAEAMEFPDGAFDVAFGRGILHHLALERAYGELARVLKPGGVALFLEPLGHNPLVNWYRARTPELRTPDEHPLMRRDVALARRHFGRVEAVMAGLATPLAAMVERRLGVAGLLGAAEALDRALLALPGLKWQAWHTCLILTK